MEKYDLKGVKKKEEHYDRAGRRHGRQTVWYENGRKDYEKEFVSGEVQGRTETWYRDGRPRESSEWSRGLRHGRTVITDTHGERYESDWWGGGIANGTVIVEWYEGNKAQGAYRTYTSDIQYILDGRPARAYVFRKGVQVLETEWFPSGRKKSEFEYKEGVMHGRALMWHENGVHKLEAQIRAGRLEGPRVRWYESGETEAVQTFRNDLAHGPYLEWYESGGRKWEELWQDGRLSKVVGRWYEDGRPMDLSVHEFESFNYRLRELPAPWFQVNAEKLEPKAQVAYLRTRPDIYLFAVAEPLPQSVSTTEDLARAILAGIKTTSEAFAEFKGGPLEANGLKGMYTGALRVVKNTRETHFIWTLAHHGMAYRIVLLTLGDVSQTVLLGELKKILPYFDLIDPDRRFGVEELRQLKPEVKVKPVEEYRSAAFAYSLKNLGKGWLEWDTIKKMFPSVDFAAVTSDNYAGVIVVPVYLHDLKPTPEELTAVLFGRWGQPWPPPNLRTVSAATDAGAEYEHRGQLLGRDLFVRTRIVRKKSFAYLCSTIRTSADERYLRLLDGVLAGAAFGEGELSGPPAFSTAQTIDNAAVLNQIGLHLQDAKAYDRAVPFFKKAWEVHPEEPVILENLLAVLHQTRAYREGVEVLDREIPRFERRLSLRRIRARFNMELESFAAARADFEKLLAASPDDEDLIFNLAGVLWKLDEKDEAIRQVGSRWDKNKSPKLGVFLAQLHRARSEYDTALSVLDRTQSGRAVHPEITYERIENLLARGDYTKARDLGQMLIDQRIGSAAAYTYLGMAEYLLKQYKRAKESLEKALALRPEDESVKKTLATVSALLGQGDNSLLKNPIPAVPYAAAFDVQALRKTPTASPYFSDHNAAYLLKVKAVEYEKGKTHRTTYRYVIRILNEKGKADFAEIDFSFNPTYESLFVNHLAVYNARGDRVAEGQMDQFYVVDAAGEIRTTGEKSAKLPVPGVAPDHVIDVMVTRETRGSDRFGFERHFFTSVYPVQEQHYALSGDVGKLVYTAERLPAPVVEPGRLAFKLVQPPVLYIESFLPAVSKFIPYAAVADPGSWQAELSEYYAGVKTLLEPDDKVRGIARELTEGCPTDRCRAERLVRYVQKNLNYVAIEFGRRARTPNPVSQTLRQKYGDCKDHSVLLHALLTSAGIPSKPALVHATGEIDKGVPSLDQFNHMVVLAQVGGEEVVLDCTGKYVSDLFRPFPLSGRPILPVAPEASFTAAPAYPADAAGVTCVRDVTWSGQTGVDVQETVVMRGYLSDGFREILGSQSRSVWSNLIARYLDRSGRDLVLRSFSAEGIDQLDSPVVLRLDYAVDGKFETLPDQTVGILPAYWENSLLAVPKVSRRHHPFENDLTGRFETEVRFRMPAGHALKNADILGAARIDEPFLKGASGGDVSEDGFRFRSTCDFLPATGDAAAYASYARAVSAALDRLQPRVVLGRKAN